MAVSQKDNGADYKEKEAFRTFDWGGMKKKLYSLRGEGTASDFME